MRIAYTAEALGDVGQVLSFVADQSPSHAPDVAPTAFLPGYARDNVTTHFGEEAMNRNAFLVFAAVVSIVYGIGNVLMPALVNEMHGLTSSPSTSLISRYFGSSLLGLGVIVWLARNATDSDALSAIMRGGLVVAVAGLIVSVHAMMAGLMNTMGWIPVIIQALLALGFVYFALIKR